MKIAKRLPLICLFVIVLCVFLPEIIILEIKYNQIGGGFLQAYRLATPVEIFTYLFSAFVIFALCVAVAFYLVRSLSLLLSFRTPILMVHFTAIFAGSYGMSIFLRYQLHIYFSDAVDLAVIKGLAGDLETAVIYVLQESVVLIIPAVVVVGVYLVVLTLLKRHMDKHGTYREPPRTSTRQISSDIAIALVLSVVAGSLLFVFKQNPKINYGLRRQIAGDLFLTTFDYLADIDGDGWSSFSQPIDHAPWNPAIHPGSIDLPNNDIDENGLGGDFKPLGELTQLPLAKAPATLPKHLIVIVMESARADALWKRIDNSLVMPNLAALAEKGTYVEQAFSHTGYTSTSLNSLFSGSFSAVNHPASLFRQFSNAGFKVSVISGQDESWGDLDVQIATREVADFFYDPQEDPDRRVFSSRLPSSIKLSEKALLEHFRENVLPTDWQVPQFVYFNFQAGHFPYYHEGMARRFVREGIPRSKISANTRSWLQNTYWNAIHHADLYIGELLTALRAKGVLKDTLIVVLGDHGESLFDDGFLGHGHHINDTQLHIPLVFSWPRLEIREPIGIINLFEIIATLYDLPTRTSIHRYDALGCVLHFLGKLESPTVFGHTCGDGKRVTYNKRDQLIQFDKRAIWQSISALEGDAASSARLGALVRHWENAVWIENQYENKFATK
jgi:hypothetical protein